MRNWLLSICTCISMGCFAAGNVAEHYGDHPLRAALVERMVAEHDFDRDTLNALFVQAEKKQSIITAMTRPAEKVKLWKDYRNIFIQEKRIDLGVSFWREHSETLQRAQQQYGVDPAIIVAIIGVETYYGRNKGSYRVIDALSTLAFDYPKRSTFFTKELESFLLLAREQSQNPLALKGSYAGAMGYGQFMPSSYRAYAVDFSGDGFTDIWNNPTDAIGSVANYFVKHGWRANKPVVTRASAAAEYNEKELNKLKKPVKTLTQLKIDGFDTRGSFDPKTKAFPMRLSAEKGDEFWLGFANFYVITRYNHSHRYAMAVYQLSELIRERVSSEGS